MKKRLIQFSALVMVLCMFSGCSFVHTALLPLIPEVTEESDLPHRMVNKIDVELNKAGSDFERHYEGQENLTMLLRMLREMLVTDVTENVTIEHYSDALYTITATYASGEQQSYWLLSGEYLKIGEKDWQSVNPDLVAAFLRYLEEHQSDDGSYIPPETLPEETEPVESTGGEA